MLVKITPDKKRRKFQIFPNFVGKKNGQNLWGKKITKVVVDSKFLFQFCEQVFFQFCEVGGLAIIHNQASPNLVTGWRWR
jgi:hypothetical protein